MYSQQKHQERDSGKCNVTLEAVSLKRKLRKESINRDAIVCFSGKEVRELTKVRLKKKWQAIINKQTLKASVVGQADHTFSYLIPSIKL